jgi:hypothetical protein
MSWFNKEGKKNDEKQINNVDKVKEITKKKKLLST